MSPSTSDDRQMQIQIARAAARDAAGAVLLAVMRGRCAEGADFKEPPTLESPSACGGYSGLLRLRYVAWRSD